MQTKKLFLRLLIVEQENVSYNTFQFVRGGSIICTYWEECAKVQGKKYNLPIQ